MKGEAGLQEMVEETVGEEKGRAIIHEPPELLQTLSPWRDSVIELVNYEKQLYAVAGLAQHRRGS